MNIRCVVSSVLIFAALSGAHGGVCGQAVSEPEVRSSGPARFAAGDTLRVSFRFDVPESVGRARVRVLLLSGEKVVGAVRRVRPSVAAGSGTGQALEVFADPVVADRVRIVLSGPDDFIETSDLPLGVGGGALTAPAPTGQLVRPGWVDPGDTQDPDAGPPTPAQDSVPGDRVVVLAVDPALPLAVLPESPRDTLTVQEAIRFSPAALRRLTTRIDPSTVVLPSGTELLRRNQNPALGELLRSPAVAAELDRPLAPPGGGSPATPDTTPDGTRGTTQDTLAVPGPWTIEADGSMRRSWPDGTQEVVDADGNRMTCAPDRASGEMRCMMPLFAQIPRVIPSSELATVDVAWLESMDAWLEQLAADALSEMRALVADDASIEAYLGLEEGQNLYQRLDQRLEFLNRLIN